MLTQIFPNDVSMECKLDSPVKKYASQIAGVCFLILPTTSPRGSVSTNVLKKSSPSASRKLVPSQMLNLLEFCLSHLTVEPPIGSLDSHISSPKKYPVGMNSGSRTS